MTALEERIGVERHSLPLWCNINCECMSECYLLRRVQNRCQEASYLIHPICSGELLNRYLSLVSLPAIVFFYHRASSTLGPQPLTDGHRHRSL